MQTKLLLWTVLFFNAIAAQSQGRQANAYYILDERSGKVYIQHGNLADDDAVEWQVRLFSDSVIPDPSARYYWGLISGESASDVMRQLKSAQDFQKSYAQFMHKDYRLDASNYFNFIGPIAVHRSVSKSNEVMQHIKKLKAIKDKVVALKETYSRAKVFVDKIYSSHTEKPADTQNNPYANVGQVTREYAKLLSVALHNADRINATLNSSDGAVLDDTGRQLDTITDELKTCEPQALAISQAISDATRSKEEIVSPERLVVSTNKKDVIPNLSIQGNWQRLEEVSVYTQKSEVPDFSGERANSDFLRVKIVSVTYKTKKTITSVIVKNNLVVTEISITGATSGDDGTRSIITQTIPLDKIKESALELKQRRYLGAKEDTKYIEINDHRKIFKRQEKSETNGNLANQYETLNSSITLSFTKDAVTQAYAEIKELIRAVHINSAPEPSKKNTPRSNNGEVRAKRVP